MKWKVLNTYKNSASKNMEIDKKLLESLEEPTIHFYEWEKSSATFGHFVDPAKYLNLEEVSLKNLDLVRRPTGGGIIFHIWDFAFSVLLPTSSKYFSLSPLKNYAFVNEAVLKTVQHFLDTRIVDGSIITNDEESLDKSCERFCMARPTKYDVVVGGKKVAGSAQRRDKKGFLHQGSIALTFPDYDYLNDLLLPNTKVKLAMQNFTYPLFSTKGKRSLEEVKKELGHILEKQLSEMYE